MRSIQFLISLFSVSFFVGNALAQDVQLLSPDITFTAKEVFFKKEMTYLGLDGKPHKTRVALKLLLRGKGFQEHATGPRFFLGKRLADAHYISPDGKMVAVYFYDLLKIPRQAKLRIESPADTFVTLKQPFIFEEVHWLLPEIRQHHGLPDLRKRIAADDIK